MDTRQRIKQLMDQRGWTEYRLALNCGLSQSTISNIFRRNTTPSVATLETICTAFGITLSQFFAEGDMIDLNPELKEVFEHWISLTSEQKELVLQMLRTLNSGKA